MSDEFENFKTCERFDQAEYKLKLTIEVDFRLCIFKIFDSILVLSIIIAPQTFYNFHTSANFHYAWPHCSGQGTLYSIGCKIFGYGFKLDLSRLSICIMPISCFFPGLAVKVLRPPGPTSHVLLDHIKSSKPCPTFCRDGRLGDLILSPVPLDPVKSSETLPLYLLGWPSR